MARAYSLDLRERVVTAVEAGHPPGSAAKTFMASVVKWLQRHRVIGTPAALKMGGRRPFVVAREKDWLLARIAEKPDLTLRALLEELANRGLVVSYYALWHFLRHEGVTFKKSLPASEQDRPDVAFRRERKARQAAVRSRPARLHRRNPGQNQYDAHPRPMPQRRAPPPPKHRETRSRQSASAPRTGVAHFCAHRKRRHHIRRRLASKPHTHATITRLPTLAKYQPK
jgi:transposase